MIPGTAPPGVSLRVYPGRTRPVPAPSGVPTATSLQSGHPMGVGAGGWSTGAAWADYDHDGYVDLFVAGYVDVDPSKPPQPSPESKYCQYRGIAVMCGPRGLRGAPDLLYHNNGDGTFTEVSRAAGVSDERRYYGLGVVWGDYDNDGAQGWGTARFDYDNDGDLDIYVVNGHVYPQVDRHPLNTKYRQRVLLFENLGNGAFREVGLAAGLTAERCGRGGAYADLDGDGDLDLVINNMDDAPTVLLNEGGNRNHWLRLALEGTKSNRSAVGARATITAGGRTAFAEVKAGSSYLSQNELVLHFGLGAATRAERLEIRWPSGLRETFQDLAADRLYRHREGAADISR